MPFSESPVIRHRFPLVFTIAVAAMVVVIFAAFARWRGLPFSINPNNILNVVAPLFLAAGFIERAVEVIISPWRDSGATKLEQELSRLKSPQTVAAISGANTGGAPGPTQPTIAVATASVGTPEQLYDAANKLADYKGMTQQCAFVASFSLSLAVACIGVRALWPLLDRAAKDGFESASARQQGTFLIVDVILTAALLAGGADGIHAVVNSFTTLFNVTTQKAQQSTHPSS